MEEINKVYNVRHIIPQPLHKSPANRIESAMTTDSVSQQQNTTIREHEKTLSPDADAARDHFDRAVASLRQSEWDKARADLASAADAGLDVASVFTQTYGDAGDFEDAFDVDLPPDIADIVDPISEEEDAAFAKELEEAIGSELVSEECVMAILRGEDGC